MVNNINTVELGKFADAVKEDPMQARKSKRVEGQWVFEEGKPQLKATLSYPRGQTTIECELPPFAGGWGGSPDPVSYCLCGLAACYATTFVASAASEGVILDELKIVAENELDLRKQLGISDDNIVKQVKFTVFLRSGTPREKLQKIKEMADNRCPGVECITRAIPLTTEIA